MRNYSISDFEYRIADLKFHHQLATLFAMLYALCALRLSSFSAFRIPNSEFLKPSTLILQPYTYNLFPLSFILLPLSFSTQSTHCHNLRDGLAAKPQLFQSRARRGIIHTVKKRTKFHA